MKSICVFCGSSPGSRPEYTEAAIQLGQTLAKKKLRLIYGGANVGIMGKLAHSVLDAGGDVTGVMPKKLVEKEVALTELADLRVVDSMHERKALMSELSDGFIALPGGLGTIEEFFEVLTWAQLGIHQKPCGLLNTCGYYDKLMNFIDHSFDQNFINPDHRALFLIEKNPNELIKTFENYEPKIIDKADWLLKLKNS